MRKYVLLLILVSSGAQADNGYGYLRVGVTSYTAGHDYPATLVANGRDIETFRHTDGPRDGSAVRFLPWKSLSAAHISSAQETSISTRYNFLRYCRFDFIVEYSIDGVNSVVPLGRFTAPLDGTAGRIPLSTNCEFGMRVCSSDAGLQAKIQVAHNRYQVEKYNKFKADYDSTLRARQALAREQAARVAAELAQARLGDISAGERVLKEHIDRWEAELEKLTKDQLAVERERLREETSVDPAAIADKAKAIAMQQRRREAIENMRASPLTNQVYQLVLLDHALEEMLKREREMLRQMRKDRTATSADIRRMDAIEQSTGWVRNEILRGETFMNTMGALAEYGIMRNGYIAFGLGISQLVLGRNIITGREYSADEYLYRACKLMIRHALPWKQVRNFLATEPDAPKQELIRGVESKVRDGACQLFTNYDP